MMIISEVIFMLANAIENNENKPERKICEYKGVTYFILTDMQGKCFIDINGEWYALLNL